MFSGQQIRDMERESAARAAKAGRLPFVVEREDLDDWRATEAAGALPRLPFPDLGDHVPAGWHAVDDPLFVDASGWGSEREPALTVRGLLAALRPGLGYGIVSQGQFQVYVQAFDTCPGPGGECDECRPDPDDGYTCADCGEDWPGDATACHHCRADLCPNCDGGVLGEGTHYRGWACAVTACGTCDGVGGRYGDSGWAKWYPCEACHATGLREHDAADCFDDDHLR
jgi:hypothetical protein